MTSRKQALTLFNDLLILAAQVEEALIGLPEDLAADRGETTKWTLEPLFKKRTGYTSEQLRQLRRRTDIIEGVHFINPPAGKRAWCEEEFELWQESRYQTPGTPGYNAAVANGFMSPSSSMGTGSGSDAEYQQRLRDLKKQRASAKKSITCHAEAS